MKKRGRRPLHPEDRKSRQLSIRLKPEEFDRLEEICHVLNAGSLSNAVALLVADFSPQQIEMAVANNRVRTALAMLVQSAKRLEPR